MLNIALNGEEEKEALHIAQAELAEKYFATLEANEVEYLVFEGTPKGGYSTHVKDKYALASDEEMIEYIERQNA